ncbi:hypothetical protein [Dendronalium phyllosphericum]|nr:hypothetical protein [Dendronalium phyllosphericum]
MSLVAVYLEQLKNNESSQSYTNSLKFGNKLMHVQVAYLIVLADD